MVERSTSTQEGPRWNWKRTNQTQRALMDAAVELFVDGGYAGTSVEDIVQRSGISIGSLYHHFGNKAGLYLALWEAWVQSLEEAVSKAILALQKSGETRSVPLFLAGARAYLESGWKNRLTGSMFFAQDGPSGFEVRLRNGRHEWLRQVIVLLRVSDAPLDRLTVSVMIAIVAEGAREVIMCRNRSDAEEMIEATLTMIERVGVSELAVQAGRSA